MKFHRLGSLECFSLLGVLALCCALVGCAANTYKASKLPAQFAAAPPSDNDILNLSGLASNSVSVDVIQPGDVLEVSLVTDYSKLATTTTPVRVGEDGMVVIPLIGKVSVGGMEVERAEQAINSESVARGIFTQPCVTVTMKQYRTRKVSVVGAVKKPGAYELPRGASSLMAALVAADGLSEEADTIAEVRHTDIRQAYNHAAAPRMVQDANGNVVQASFQQTQPGVPSVVTVDLKAASAGSIQVPELYDGDVVHVAKRKVPPVYVLGLVRNPGQFTFPPTQGLRVLDAIALGGGVSNAFAEDVVVLRRVSGSKDPVRIEVSIQKAKEGSDNIALSPGDTVSVERTAATTALDAFNTFFRVNVGGSISWF